MSRRFRLHLMFVALLLATFALPSWAQAARPVVRAKLSKRRVEVGSTFRVELTATVENGATPRNPELQLGPEFQIVGTRVGSKTQAHFGGGGQLLQRIVTASWEVLAHKEGRFTLPAPTVRVGAKRVKARARLTIRVVAGGSGGRLSDLLDDDSEDLTLEDLTDRGRALALDDAEDRYGFVRIVADKTAAVVGEQVTLAYYFYRRNSRYALVGQREPPLGDFVRQPLESTPGTSMPVTTLVGGRRYNVRLLDRVAVFPVRAGKLSTGKMEIGFSPGGMNARVYTRYSNDLALDVREPPLQGRPVGYRLGDVGTFQINATVEPKATVLGESVAVNVRVTGIGAVPPSLKLPQRTGVDWLPPVKREEIGSNNDKVGGWRSFRYGVRFTELGEIDLGTIELSYFDPQTRRYGVTKAELGKVMVEPVAAPAQAGSAAPSGSAAPPAVADEDPFAAVAAVRPSLRAYKAATPRQLTPLWFWSLLLLPPLSVLVIGGMRRAAGGFSTRRQQRANDPAVHNKAALKELSASLDPKDTAAICERALHHGIEAACGLKSRAVLVDQLASRLEQAGLEASLADETVALLRACSNIRFEPAPATDPASDVSQRTRKLSKRLLKHGQTRAVDGEDVAA